MNHPGNTGEFVDGAIGANNPAKLLLAEAQRIFSPSRGVSCIVSIGTGRKYISNVKAPGFMQRILQRMLFPGVPINAILAAKDIVTNCEAVAEDLDRRFALVPGLYCRFNVEDGLTAIKLHEYRKLGQIKALTIQYLQEFLVEEKVKRASHFLYSGLVSNIPVEHLA